MRSPTYDPMPSPQDSRGEAAIPGKGSYAYAPLQQCFHDPNGIILFASYSGSPLDEKLLGALSGL